MMNKDELLNMVENPNLISGIYNYCDRWCERCNFASRCAVYAMEKEAFPDQEPHDIENEKFWDRLHDSFKLTFELLHDFAKEQGIDLLAGDLDEETRKEGARTRKTKQSRVVQAAKKYSTMVTKWLKTHKHLFTEKQEMLTKEDELGIGDPEATATTVVDAVEVIRWYQHFIYVKLMRALDGEGLEKEMEHDEEMEEFPKDSDGSAKVALIGIDRSIGAWGELQKHFGEDADSLINILVHLSRLRTGIEMRFSRARSFVRPGFDQEV